jgi:glutathione S-transferase
MALEEKGVGYDLVPVDVFAEDGPPAWYLERHPFGRIPAFEHGAFRLFETVAITRYIDEAFNGPALQPADAKASGVMNQIIGLIDSYAYRAMVWDVAVERLERDPPDEKRIAAGLRTAETALQTLVALKADNDWLIGDRISLADLHAAPVIAYFIKVEEGQKLVAAFPKLGDWWARISTRPSFLATEKAG